MLNELDLEDQIYNQDIEPFNELEYILLRYGHGDCHLLSLALHERHGFPLKLLRTARSGFPIHSYVVSDNLCVDAYGINSAEKTFERYRQFARENYSESLVCVDIDANTLQELCSVDERELQDALTDFSVLLKRFNIALPEISSAPHAAPKKPILAKR